MVGIDSEGPVARGSRASTGATAAPEHREHYQSLYAYTALPTYATAILNAAHAERMAINFRSGKVTPASMLSKASGAPARGGARG